MAGDGPAHLSPLGERCWPGCSPSMRDFTLLYAPNINSYKRYQPGSFAPTAVRWGADNRTCALRLVGHAPASLRVENRVPGGDVNPYLAVAAMVAAALHGIENELTLEPECAGNAYDDADAPRVPATLREALGAVGGLRRWPGRRSATRWSRTTRTTRAVELAAFDAAVTDWELFRGFERL